MPGGGKENAEDPLLGFIRSSWFGLANACCLDDTQRMTEVRKRPAMQRTRQADPKWPFDPSNPRWPPSKGRALQELDPNGRVPVQPLHQPKPAATSGGSGGYMPPLGFGTPAKHLHRVRPVSGASAQELAAARGSGGGGYEEIMLPEGFVPPKADEKRDRSAGVGIAFEAITCQNKTSLFVAAVMRQGPGALPEPSVFIGDELIGVDGTYAGSLAPSLVQERMLGPPGSICHLQLRGEGGQGDRLVAVKRKVQSEMGQEFCYPMRAASRAAEKRREGILTTF